jgi:hypothetical protein
MKTAFVVLGMHRSGTSSVAGALVQLGATPPVTLMAPKPENPKGFWESEAVMVVNDQLLSRCGSSWRDWRPLDDAALKGEDQAELRAEALRVLEAEFGGQDRIVLKDPRICRLFPFWEAVLAEAGYRPVVVTPLRAPMEVAASLSARNEMSEAYGWRLWLEHVLAAEVASRGCPRHFMAWDAFLSDWRGQIDMMSTRLGTTFEVTPATEALMSDFLAPELKHHRAPAGVAAPALVREVQAALVRLAVEGETAEGLARLDDLRGEFGDAAHLFADVA